MDPRRLVLCFALAACGDGAATIPGGADGGHALDADGGAAVDAPSSDGAGDPDAGPDAGDADAAPEAAPDGATPTLEIELVETRGVAATEWYAYAAAWNPWYPEGGRIEALRVGDCAFYTPKLAGFCDPPCEPPQLCTFEDRCGEHPDRIVVGVIAVTGLRVGLELVPEAPEGTDYWYYAAHFDPEPADGDLFAAGAELTATSAGGDYAPLSVSTAGVAPLEAALPCPPGADPGADLVVTWTPADGEAVIRFALQSGNHGGQFSQIHCEAADAAGALVVDHTLLAAYLADWHPVDSWQLERVSEGTAHVPSLRAVLRAKSALSCSY